MSHHRIQELEDALEKARERCSDAEQEIETLCEQIKQEKRKVQEPPVDTRLVAYLRRIDGVNRPIIAVREPEGWTVSGAFLFGLGTHSTWEELLTWLSDRRVVSDAYTTYGIESKRLPLDNQPQR